MTQGSLNHFPPLLKLVTLITIVLTGSLVTSLISLVLAGPVFGVDIYSVDDVYANVPFMRSLQIIQSLLVFILPSGLAVYLLYPKEENVIPGKGRFTIVFLLIAGLIMFLSQGFISWTGWLNQQLNLPDSWQAVSDWIASKEDEAMSITDQILQMADWKEFLITVFIIAVLPAIGEEWLFRGLIQRELANSFRNVHVAIFVTAIIFSAIHIQFLTFLPRFVLGLILGYLMIYSRTIWMPIAAHFFNNFLAVLIYCYFDSNGTDQPALEMPDQNPFDVSVIASLFFIIALIIVTRKLGKLQKV